MLPIAPQGAQSVVYSCNEKQQQKQKHRDKKHHARNEEFSDRGSNTGCHQKDVFTPDAILILFFFSGASFPLP
jgi:hypothetical protein